MLEDFEDEEEELGFDKPSFVTLRRPKPKPPKLKPSSASLSLDVSDSF